MQDHDGFGGLRIFISLVELGQSVPGNCSIGGTIGFFWMSVRRMTKSCLLTRFWKSESK